MTRMRKTTPGLLTVAASMSMLAACALPGTATSPTVSSLPTMTPSNAATPTATPNSCSNATVLATWGLTQLAEQTLVIPVSESDVASVTAEVAAGAGGVILFGSSAPATLATSLHDLTASAPGGIAPFVMTDEEGGVVQRMANLVGSLPSARQMAATMSPAQIRELVTSVALRMHAAGITMDLAPVLDLDNGVGPNNRDPDGTRSFGLNPSAAAADGIAFLQGLEAGGVVPVIKHFPGLGEASANTDVAPATTQPWSALQHAGIVPFESAIASGAPVVMIANATVPGLSALPASISPAVMTTVLRHQLGFEGLVLTDSLSAGALAQIGYSVPRAVVAAITAGADMVLYTAASPQVASLTAATAAALVAAVNAGTLDRARLVSAVTNILAAKRVDLCAG
ncbi:MAG: glycoside hydrolase family 3 N-terminal domain-containing protein [Candidatus Dormibacteria bacterium]